MIIVPACDLLVSCGGDIESEFQFALRNTARGNIEMTLDRIPRGITAHVTSVEASDTHGLRWLEIPMPARHDYSIRSPVSDKKLRTIQADRGKQDGPMDA